MIRESSVNLPLLISENQNNDYKNEKKTTQIRKENVNRK